MVGVDESLLNEVWVHDGEQAHLPCNVVVKENVLWKHTVKNPSVNTRNISFDGRIVCDEPRRYYMGRNPSDYYDLYIEKASISDGGRYECIERNGNGISHYVYLFTQGW